MPPQRPNHNQLTTGIIIPSTPETGPVDESMWNGDVRAFVLTDPEHHLTTEEAEAAYDETYAYLVDRGRDMVAQDPAIFNQMVRDMYADYGKANDRGNGLSDDERAETYRVTELEADVLLPEANEPQPMDPNLAVLPDAVKRQVDDALKKLTALSERHPDEGMRQLVTTVASLQHIAGQGMAPYVRGAVEQAFEGAERALAEAERRAPDLTAEIYAADRRAEHLQAEAEAAAATDPAQHRPSAWRSKVTRPLVKGATRLRLGGDAWRADRNADYAAHDRTGQERANDDQKREAENAYQTASNAKRLAGLKRYEAIMHREQTTGGLRRAANNARALAEVLLAVDSAGEMQVVTNHGIAIDPQRPPAQIVQDMKDSLAANAPGIEYAVAEGDPDKNDPVVELREVLKQEEAVVRHELWESFQNGHADALGELDALAVKLQRKIEALTEQRDAVAQNGPSLEYTLASERLISAHRLFYEAMNKYIEKSVITAPFESGGVRNFGGRRRMVQLEDGSFLVGDKPQPADPNNPDEEVEVPYRIYWPNGDVGFPATQEDVASGHAFEARSHRPAENTNKSHNKPEEESYGNFVRITPAGRLRRPQRLRQTKTWKHYEEDTAADFIRAEQAKRRQEIQDFNPNDATDVSDARDAYNEAIEAFSFRNNLNPREAEDFLTKSAQHLTALTHQVREINQNQALMDRLDPNRFREEVDAEQLAIVELKRQPKPDWDTITAREQALRQRLHLASTARIHRAQLDGARESIVQLERARYNTLRAAAYDGIAHIDDNGMITLRADNKHRDKEIRHLLGLPEGEWHFLPTGQSIHVTWDKKNKKTVESRNPAENVALAA